MYGSVPELPTVDFVLEEALEGSELPLPVRRYAESAIARRKLMGQRGFHLRLAL